MMGSNKTLDFDEETKLSRNHFSTDSVKNSISKQKEDTLKWMRDGKQSYGPNANLDHLKPWWTVPPKPSTNLERLVFPETRSRVLRDRAYEHGILHFLYGLCDKGVISHLDKETIDIVINDAVTPGVLNQLLARKAADHLLDGVKLRDLRDLYGHGSETKPAKIRDRVVKRLHPLGILSVRYSGEYDISIGPVAEAFFIDVYIPIVNETDINIEDK